MKVCQTLVAHNAALLLPPAPGLTWGMEARYPNSQGAFTYNLSNRHICSNRDGAGGVLRSYVTGAEAEWFVNVAAGDLHPRPTAGEAID